MSHRFQITSLTLSRALPKSRIFYFRIKISETYWFKTAEQHPNQKNNIPFLESNEFQIPEGMPLYYSVELVEVKPDGNYLVDKKMLFEKDINKKLEFTIDGVVGVLDYRLSITNREERRRRITGEISKKLKEHVEEFSETNSETKLEIMRMGGLYYNFVNRLDLLVRIKNYMREIVRWTNPIYTILFGIVITLVILMPALSIMILGLAIILSRHRLLDFGEEISSINKSKPRLIVPKQNFILLQNSMDLYCETYEHIKSIFQNEDKTELIILINAIVANAWGMLILPIFFNLRDIVIIGLWIALVLQHPKGKQMKNIALKMKREIVIELVNFLQNYSIQNKLLPRLLQFIEMPQREILVKKTFYVYQFQNWWFGVWDEPSGDTFKWSDKHNTCGILPRDTTPKGYTWTSEWLIDVDVNHTDKDGFVYATTLTMEFHAHNNLLDTIRRRRWKRICITESHEKAPKLKLDWIVDGNLPSSRVNFKKKV